MDYEQILAKLQEWSALYGLKIVGAIAILIIGRIIVGIASKLVYKMAQKAKFAIFTYIFNSFLIMTSIIFPYWAIFRKIIIIAIDYHCTLIWKND